MAICSVPTCGKTATDGDPPDPPLCDGCRTTVQARVKSQWHDALAIRLGPYYQQQYELALSAAEAPPDEAWLKPAQQSDGGSAV